MGIYDFIFDNGYEEDAKDAEARIREKYPLLLHEQEKILLAFKGRGGKGRDKEYFTSHRILIKDGKGIGGKRKNYKSIPYSSIQGFACDTAGKLDGDVSVQIWSTGIPYASISLATAAVDIFQIQQFLNTKVNFSGEKGSDVVDSLPPNMDQKQSTAGNIVDWFGDNAQQVSASEVEQMCKTEMPVLVDDEKVELAFKSGRDYTVITDKRYLTIDVQGLFGKKIVFKTVLWDAIKAYSVQTAGAFLDRDTEITLYTDMLSMETITQDFRNGKANLFAIQTALCNHILGHDVEPLPDIDLREGTTDDDKGFWWFRDNQRPLDAVEIDRVYHSSPRILREKEQVEMAFKGRRDVTLFTNLRVIIIDPKGLIGKQVEYTSLPWTSIVGHCVRTSGKYFDFDSEVGFYTEMCFNPGRAGDEDNPPIPATPRKSYIELDFNKNMVDMNVLNYYLSRRLLFLKKADFGAPIPLEALTVQHAEPQGLENFFQWIGGNQRELDANAIDEVLHTSTRILLDDEKVLMAFKAGRDSSLFTNLRVITIDVQGLSGQKVEYTSIPYFSIHCWSVETAGIWDQDTELNLHTKNRWSLAKVKMDFRTGKADIQQINRFLSALVVGKPTDVKVDMYRKNYESGVRESNPITFKSFGLLNNAWEVDVHEYDSKLRSDPAILLDEEKTLRAFQSGRDVTVYTDRRIVIIDVQGMSGKRVKYKSIPYKYMYGFEFETAGNLDRDAEVYQYTDVSKVVSTDTPRDVPYLKTQQSILVKDVDIYEVAKVFIDNTLFSLEDEVVVEEEAEIDLSYW